MVLVVELGNKIISLFMFSSFVFEKVFICNKTDIVCNLVKLQREVSATNGATPVLQEVFPDAGIVDQLRL